LIYNSFIDSHNLHYGMYSYLPAADAVPIEASRRQRHRLGELHHRPVRRATIRDFTTRYAFQPILQKVEPSTQTGENLAVRRSC
jgi:hypothetical protein